MTFDGPDDDIFGHLDDPSPPTYGGNALSSVVTRGSQIRRRRRATYTLSSAAVVVLLAGTAIGVAATNGPGKDGTAQVTSSNTPTISVSPTKSTKHPSGKKHHVGPPVSNGSTTPPPANVSPGGQGGGHSHPITPTHKATPTSTPTTICTTPPVSTPPSTDPTATSTDSAGPVQGNSPSPKPTCTTITVTPTPTPTGTANAG